MISLNTYVIRARLFPAVLAIAPLMTLATTGPSWQTFGLPEVITAAMVGVIFVVFSDIARRYGRRIENSLFSEFGGKPSVRLLRFSDDTFDDLSKARYHRFLSSAISVAPIDAEAEKLDPIEADMVYNRFSNWLVQNTRDQKKFEVLFEENITYGFRRNLLGLKIKGLALNLAVVASVLWLLSPFNDFFDVSDKQTQLRVVLVVALIHAIYFLFFVTKKSVKQASEIYARQLILSCESLMAPQTSDVPRPD